MATAELRLLGILGGELVSDVVEKLDVALLGILLHGIYEGPGHGSGSLGGDRGIGPGISSSVYGLERPHIRSLDVGMAYEVWSSLLPDHMITSAGDVLVASVLLYASSPFVAFLKKPKALLTTPPRSPRL